MQVRSLSPSRSASPCTGRRCTPSDRPDTPRYTTGSPASRPQCTGCSVSAPSPQTAACRSGKHTERRRLRVKNQEQGHEHGGGVRLLSASVGSFREETCPISSRFRPLPRSFHVKINEGPSCAGAAVHQGRAGPPSQAGNTPWSD